MSNKVKYMLRGGSWPDGPRGVRSANRSRFTPDARNNVIGFRLTLKEAQMRNKVLRVLHGGSWSNVPRFVRSSTRYGLTPGLRINAVGFRLTLKKTQQKRINELEEALEDLLFIINPDKPDGWFICEEGRSVIAKAYQVLGQGFED